MNQFNEESFFAWLSLSFTQWRRLHSEQALTRLRSGQRLEKILEEFTKDEKLAFLKKPRELHREFQIEMQRIKKFGIKLTWPGQLDYPRAFNFIPEPPMALTYIGEPTWLEQSGLAVVGSREPRFESMQWMDIELKKFVAEGDCVVVSGGARGIDQKAHQLALNLKMPTIVFLPSGLMNLYPKDLGTWQKAILNVGGTFVSEWSLYEPMRKFHFLKRNRLIAGISKLVLVIEAAARSGTGLTAKLAVEQGQGVAVIPGHPLDSHFAGSLELLVAGAAPVVTSGDLQILWSLESTKWVT